MSTFRDLGNASFVSIESFRKNGKGVQTPVWITAEGEHLYCWTIADSGKVKRIRNNPRVNLARCDSRGNIEGDWMPATAQVLDRPQDVKAQARRMAQKYGLLFRLFQWVGWLRRNQYVVIEFSEA